MGRHLIAAFTSASLFLSFPANAQPGAPASAPAAADADAAGQRPPIYPTSAFAAHSQLTGAKLSPDGKRIASRSSIGGLQYVLLFDAASGQPTGRIPLNKGDRVRWLRWAGNDKILLSAQAFDEYNRFFTRLFVLDLKNGKAFVVGDKNGAPDQDNVIWVAEDGSSAMISVQRMVNRYPTVYRYELTEDGKREEVEDPKPSIWNWLADENGVLRIGAGTRRNTWRIYYRSGPDDKMKVVESVRLDDLRKPNGDLRYFSVLGVEAGTDIGYVLAEGDDGKVALRSYDFAQGQIVGTIFEHETQDIEDVGFSREGKPIWVTYTDDSGRIVWLDEDMGRVQRGLERGLAEPQVTIMSRSRDNGRMLVHAGSAGDPGALYVFDAQAKTLEALGELKPALDFRNLAQPKAVQYQARDGTTIHAYLTLPKGRPAKGLPLIVMPHGGPYGVRDSLQYDDWVQLLANRGYAVIQPNFRGSGGYGEAFFDLGVGQIGRAMQDDLDDAMDWLVKQGIADPGRVCLVGASYGGYAALWGVTRNPERYRCAASWAGVTDWDSMLRYDNQFFSRRGGRRWRERVEGAEGFDLKSVSPLQQADRIKHPILLAQGTDDGIVNDGQYHLLRRALEDRNAELETLLIEDEGHSFYEPENEQKWFDSLVSFLEKHNPADI